jgi:hypothetical protein
MFARWQKRTGVKGAVHWNAVLVEAIRVDGRPRQRHVGCLAGIGQQRIDGACSVTRRRLFWDGVMTRLHELHVPPEAHGGIVAMLARKVPFPTCEEYIRDHRRAHELLGPEFHSWPSHPLYDLSGVIRDR